MVRRRARSELHHRPEAASEGGGLCNLTALPEQRPDTMPISRAATASRYPYTMSMSRPLLGHRSCTSSPPGLVHRRGYRASAAGTDTPSTNCGRDTRRILAHTNRIPCACWILALPCGARTGEGGVGRLTPCRSPHLLGHPVPSPMYVPSTYSTVRTYSYCRWLVQDSAGLGRRRAGGFGVSAWKQTTSLTDNPFGWG